LAIYDWSSLYNETSVDAAVYILNVAVTQAIDLAVPSGHIKKHKYPNWFSGKLKVYIKKNYFYRRYKKYKAVFYDKYSFYRKLVTATIKPHFVNKNLKSHPKQFWEYESQFRKTNTGLIHFEINYIPIDKPRDIAEAFSKNFPTGL
jgi:hypothetical protein